MFKSLVLAGAMALTAIPAQAQTCTRDTLKTFIANYFKAVETHDLSALPTAPNLRVTENGVETKPGDGFVKTGGKATLLRSLLDTERCGTVTQALVDETINGVTEPTIVAVRLKVLAGRVTEIETLLGRKGASKMAGFDVRFLGANVPIESLVRMVRDTTPDVLVLSISLPIHLDALRRTVERVNGDFPSLPILAGGHAFRWDPDLARRLSVRYVGTEAETLVRMAKLAVGAS